MDSTKTPWAGGLGVYPPPMNIRLMDPRVVDREIDDTTYCVVLWSSLRTGRPGPQAVAADEFLITDAAGVDEVMSWARAEAGEEREVAVYVLLDGTRIRLMGHGP